MFIPQKREICKERIRLDRTIGALCLSYPEVSVLIPTHNAEATIARCINSINSQSHRPIEVIVVDNFSEDNTAIVAETLGAKVIQQRSTAASARNLGVIHSIGKYILFVDSDQVLSKGLIAECVSTCKREHALMVRIPELFIGDGFLGSCSAEWKNYYGEVERRYGVQGKILSGEPRFFEKKQLINVGMFKAGLVWGEDYDLHERMKEMGATEASVNSILYHFEPSSARDIMAKNVRYGGSLPNFSQHSHRRAFARILKHSLLAWGQTFSELNENPGVFLGCTFLLILKAFAMGAGLMAELF
jgi:glycosyltransferase involved in cell wall biosynthesis